MKKLPVFLLVSIPSLGLGLMIGGFRGYEHGVFVTAMEENKMAAAILKSEDSEMNPWGREYLKGRIYSNLATKFPNDKGYLLRKDWDFGPIDANVSKGAIGSKDSTVENGSYDAATQHLSKAEQDDGGKRDK